MNYVKDFILENWRIILEACLVITSAVVFIIRKKPVKVVDTLTGVIVKVLPALILSAEKEGLTGEKKMQFVLSKLKVILVDCGYSDDIISQYLPFAQEQVELILSTPQKKKVR